MRSFTFLFIFSKNVLATLNTKRECRNARAPNWGDESSVGILTNSTEYIDAFFGNFLRQHEIHHQTSCTYTLEQNVLVERKNRQIMEVVRTSLFGMNMPRFYWGEVVKYAAYIIN